MGRLSLLDRVRIASDETYSTWMRRCIPKAGDIVLTAEGTFGEVASPDPERLLRLRRDMVAVRSDASQIYSTMRILLASTLNRSCSQQLETVQRRHDGSRHQDRANFGSCTDSSAAIECSASASCNFSTPSTTASPSCAKPTPRSKPSRRRFQIVVCRFRPRPRQAGRPRPGRHGRSHRRAVSGWV